MYYVRMVKTKSKQKNNDDLPVVFILDMDATLVGDVKYILAYHELMKFVKDGCKHKRLEGVECKLNTNIWNPDNIPSGFMRPQLKESLLRIKEIFPTAEFFVFSLGIKSYVHNCMKFIEKQTGIKFNRPFFTREDSSFTAEYRYLKDIHGYEKIIYDVLARKYPKCKDETYQRKVSNERTIIIDDSEVWGNDNRWIQCKRYSYCSQVELDKNMLKIIYKNPELSSFIENNDPHLTVSASSKTFEEFMYDHHFHMMDIYKTHLESNKEQLKDDFFPNFVKAIQKRKHYARPFDKTFLETLKSAFV